MIKQLLFGQEAREKLLAGIEKLAHAVGSTLGPLGSNVAIDKTWNIDTIHDGVKVAKEIELEDRFENMGAQMVKEASAKTNDITGDGTTTSTILAYNMIKFGNEKLSKNQVLIGSKANSRKIRKGMFSALRVLTELIKKLSTPISKDEEVKQIATISAQDEELGTLIAQAYKKVGKDGVVTAEAGRSTEVSIEYKDGMEFDKGYASAYFVTNPDLMIAEIENPYIVVTDMKISAMNEIMPFLQNLVKVSKNIVFIADNFDEKVLAELAVNKLHNVINVLAVKAPNFGDKKRDMLQDIATITGANFISLESGRRLDSITPEDCGRADNVWADREYTRIVGGKGTKQAIEERATLLKNQIAQEQSDFEKQFMTQRLAKLTTGVAVIKIGAKTEMEVKEKLEQADDAIAATKSALDEGILPGGATALVYLSQLLKPEDSPEGEREGVEIVKKALECPFETLMDNAGLSFSMQEIRALPFGKGVDVEDGQIKEMVKAGIIDPTKVVRSAVENAIAVASIILTTDTLITDKPEEKSHD